jgi:hypothetical protein
MRQNFGIQFLMVLTCVLVSLARSSLPQRNQVWGGIGLLWTQVPTIIALDRESDVSSQNQMTAPNVTKATDNAAKPQTTSSVPPQNPKAEAWQTLQTACEGNKVAEREGSIASAVIGRRPATAPCRSLTR